MAPPTINHTPKGGASSLAELDDSLKPLGIRRHNASAESPDGLAAVRLG